MYVMVFLVRSFKLIVWYYVSKKCLNDHYRHCSISNYNSRIRQYFIMCNEKRKPIIKNMEYYDWKQIKGDR